MLMASPQLVMSASPSTSKATNNNATSDYEETKFNEAYQKAILRKKLFKEYINRHGILERMNASIEALYECEQLPEDPIQFIVEQLRMPPVPKKKFVSRPVSAATRK